MDDFDILNALLRDDALAAEKVLSRSRRAVLLEERDSQYYTLEITGTPYDTVAFKMDKFPPPNRIFKDSKRECKRADYVIISRRDRKGWIVYVEMKTGAGRSFEVERQLRGGKCLLVYCQAIVGEFWGEKRFLQDYAQRFVSVRHVGSNKPPTRDHRRPVHDRPEKMLKLTAPTGKLQFNRIV